MKKRTGLLLACTLLAALLLSGCSGQKQAEYRADVQSGVSYLQSLETIDPDTVTQKLRQMRLEKLQAERAAREQALLDDIDTVWQEFSDAVILGDSRAVGFSYYSFLDASRVLASSGERIDAIDGHIEDLKKLDPAYIFLCYGINDLGWYGSAQDYADTLLEKIRLLRRELSSAPSCRRMSLPSAGRSSGCRSRTIRRQCRRCVRKTACSSRTIPSSARTMPTSGSRTGSICCRNSIRAGPPI